MVDCSQRKTQNKKSSRSLYNGDVEKSVYNLISKEVFAVKPSLTTGTTATTFTLEKNPSNVHLQAISPATTTDRRSRL